MSLIFNSNENPHRSSQYSNYGAETAPRLQPYLADSDDSLLGSFVSEDIKRIQTVSTDDGEIHFSVLPDILVSSSNSPHRGAGFR